MYDPAILSATTLRGNPVRNTAGQDLGYIKELMFDTRMGRVVYAVLSFGGFLGLGEKLFAVPYVLLKVDTTNRCFVLNVEKEKLKEAPGFDEDDWPASANFDFVNEVYSYYGYGPYYGDDYEVRLRRPAVPYEHEAK